MTDQQQQQVAFQLLDDTTLQNIDPQTIYQQYAILRREFVNALLYVQQDFDLSSALASELQRTINENRMYREEYLKKNMELNITQQKALAQSQAIRKMERDFERKKSDTIDEQKSLQSNLERAIADSVVARENVRKTYVTLEEEFDNLLRDSLAEIMEEIDNVQHDVSTLEEQKKQIGQEAQVESNIEEIKAVLEKSRNKLTGDLEEKNKVYAALATKEKEVAAAKAETTELLEDKDAFIEKLKKDSEAMDATLKELREQAAKKRLEEDNAKEEIITKSLPKPNHVANLEEKLIIDWFARFNIEVTDFKTSFNDGLLICQLMDKIKPGMINWSKISRPKEKRPLNIFQKRTNCSVLLDTIATLGLTNTGIGAQDITDGNVKMLMGLFRTLMIWEANSRKTLL